jgi:cytoskeletal protein CcmA (bactofilin family)
MFKGEKNKVKAESPDRLNRLVSGTTLTGDLTTNSSLRIDGQINGNVTCYGKLVLGQEGVIAGDINATEVELDGTVEGNVNAEVLLIIHQTGIVKGNLITGRLVIEDGAQIVGSIQTGDLPISKSNASPKVKKSPVSKIEVAADQEKAPDIVY